MPAIKPLMIADFEEDDVLSRVSAGQGVTLVSTDQGAESGKRALEVKVAPFSTHQNLWPSVVLGPKYFTSPVDVSRHTQIEMTVRKLTPGLATLNVTFSSLPYNDGGRNLEGELCTVAGQSSVVIRVPTSAFEFNDPSAIRLMYITFPPNEREDVYRIDAVRAVYSPKIGSPAERLDREVEILRQRLQKVETQINWQAVSQDKRSEAEKEFADLGNRVSELRAICEQGKTVGFGGNYKRCKEDLGTLSRQLGKFVLLDQKDFFVWDTDPYMNIGRDETPESKGAGLQRIEVSLAQGEYRDKVFMVSACDKDARVEVSVGSGTLPRGSVQVSETLYLKNLRGEETGDAVYPLSGSLTIPAWESRQIRVRFDGRFSGLKSGRYTFQVKVRDTNSGIERVIPGTVEVFPFQLPSYDILSNNCYTEFDSSEFYDGDLLAKAVAHMKMYGLNVVYVHPVEMPTIKELDAEANVIRFDDTLFTKRVGGVLSAWKAAQGRERLTFVFTISGMYELGLKRDDLKFPGQQWKAVLAQWLKHFKEVTRGLGVADQDWMLVLGDEANESALIQKEIPMAEAIKGLDPTIRLTCNTSTIVNDPEMSRRFFKAFDILQPELNSLKSNSYLRDWLRKGGKPLWTYKCAGGLNQTGKNVYEYYRVYGWDLVKYGLTGTGVWTYCAQAQAQKSAGYVLVFRQDSDVMNARRYEVFREGVDDYRYVWMLREVARKRGPKATKDAEKTIQQAVEDVTSHPEDTSRCEKWRMRIAGEIVAMRSGTPR